MSEVRPRRSVLYLPASNERALEKAKTLPVDGLIFDLEDAVAPDTKASARELACAAAVSGAYGMRELTIRINGLGTPWHDDDLAAACGAGPDGIVVPKVGSADEVRTLVGAMEAAGAPERTALWAMIETPRAILEAAAIGSASDRLTVFVLGTNDLVKELGTLTVPGRAPVYTALSLALLGARAAGVAVLDGVYNDVRDPEGFEAECRQGRELGFDGKTLIHPGQVETANRVFAPSDEDVETARRTIAAFEAARAEGRAVATLDGRLIESLHVEIAQRTVAMSEAVAVSPGANGRESDR
ncbi:MAG TPA: CoA ester lyase [Lapillicoccus sp.]|nr:CoA ester lyase [Lapillicoccus sp.]